MRLMHLNVTLFLASCVTMTWMTRPCCGHVDFASDARFVYVYKETSTCASSGNELVLVIGVVVGALSIMLPGAGAPFMEPLPELEEPPLFEDADPDVPSLRIPEFFFGEGMNFAKMSAPNNVSINGARSADSTLCGTFWSPGKTRPLQVPMLKGSVGRCLGISAYPN